MMDRGGEQDAPMSAQVIIGFAVLYVSGDRCRSIKATFSRRSFRRPISVQLCGDLCVMADVGVQIKPDGHRLMRAAEPAAGAHVER